MAGRHVDSENGKLAGKPNTELVGKPNAELAGKPNAQWLNWTAEKILQSNWTAEKICSLFGQSPRERSEEC